MPSNSIPINGIASSPRSTPRSPLLSSSYLSGSPIAHDSIARDLEEYSDGDDDDDDVLASTDDESSGEESAASTVRPALQHSMSSSYRRPSFGAFGGSRAAILPQHAELGHLSKKERAQVKREEESLLRDNYLAPPKHPQPPQKNIFARTYRQIFAARRPKAEYDEETIIPSFTAQPSETSALLSNGAVESARDGHERRNQAWEQAVREGKIKTTWQREAKTLTQYASPLIVTFLLQYSLTVASIFTVGHLGTIELGAVSLASMTANITGYAIYQGLATSLDTLCAQAYGSGRKKLVGLQFQRMVYFLWALSLPIGLVWFFADRILQVLVPNKQSADLAGLYLKVLILGAPGYALFESGKRFVQAQGLFTATTYVLIVCAPLNAFMNWFFVWHLGWGFVGAPIAVAITDNLLPIFLFLYVYFIDGKQCWNGFTRKAFHNWAPMVKLALPGLIMVEAEFLAFEILTLAASYFGTTHLAAQSILSTITAITFQIPFPISIAASTRVANLIGATLSGAAQTSAKVAFVAATLVGVFNVILLSSLRNYIPQLFTKDDAVIELVAQVLPLCAAFQLFDALATNCSGLLRGLGRQEIGGYVNLFCYYVVAMPISFGTAFGLQWKLEGLWTGVAIALGLVSAIEAWFLYRINWEQAVEEAHKRNTTA